MEGITAVLTNLQPYIIIVLIITTIISLISLVVIVKSLNRLEKRYKKLTRGVNNKNLEEIVTQYLDNIDSVKTDTEVVKNQQLELEKRLNTCLQKVAIVRYKAFEDIGSDLSFSIALLNHNNDGVIVTGIYGRSDSIVYAKPIDKGISRYDLSEEEEQVLSEASNK